MNTLSYESIFAIIVFWIALVFGFIILICRVRRRNNFVESRVQDSASENFVNTRRIIQIYYIGNTDSSVALPSNVGNVLGKIMSNVEDQPPSYEEIVVNTCPCPADCNRNFDTDPNDIHAKQPAMTNILGENELAVIVEGNSGTSL